MGPTPMTSVLAGRLVMMLIATMTDEADEWRPLAFRRVSC